MVLIRRTAAVLLVLVVGYIVWVIALNMPGQDKKGLPMMAAGPAKTIGATSTSVTKMAVRTVEISTPASAVPMGGLVVPVAGIARAQLSDTFDDARGQGRVHDAIDIMAPRGTPVLAAAAGTVEKIFESKLGGHTLYIRRDDRAWMDYYAHLDAYGPGIVEGVKVKRGQPIATVGSTGDASPEAPHLHYAINAMAPGETWWQGKAINPYPLLVAKP